MNAGDVTLTSEKSDLSILRHHFRVEFCTTWLLHLCQINKTKKKVSEETRKLKVDNALVMEILILEIFLQLRKQLKLLLSFVTQSVCLSQPISQTLGVCYFIDREVIERTDVKKRKTILSETTNLVGLAWPSITTQMHHYSFKFFHAGTFDQSSTPSEMQHVKIFTSVRSITAQSVTNSRWP